ncbi:MAG TPA: metallophosphoesterase [Sandaracinaceae bacterium LLY-WYZ-13_1]|nr:metallophosphoesterase [Sandaracinaceae bacterium LLY-WYZ-13_1]
MLLALLLAAPLGCEAELTRPDAGPGADAAALDAGVPDAGPSDAGRPDGPPSIDAGPPDAGPPPVTRIAVLSDLNGSYGSTTYASTVHAAVERVVAWAPDLVLTTGDMVAGQRAGLDYRAMWDGFHAAVSEPLAAASIPLAVTPGNHDASGYASYAEERAIFVDEWTARRPAVDFVDDADYPLRYAFRLGPALFVSLDDTTVGALSDAQMGWLDAVLEAHEAAVTVVYGHLPLYPFAEGRETEVIGDPALEDLLVHHGVDLFVSGHHHAYYPGRRGPLRLVSMACQGASPRPLIGGDGARSRSIVRLELDAEGIRVLDAFGGPAYDERVERATLPPHVGSGETRVDRDDR